MAALHCSQIPCDSRQTYCRDLNTIVAGGCTKSVILEECIEIRQITQLNYLSLAALSLVKRASRWAFLVRDDANKIWILIIIAMYEV